MNNKKIYISGAMSNLPRLEYRALFCRAENLLRQRGYRKIVNPCNTIIGRNRWLYRLVGYKLTLLYDLWLLWHCDAICMLPNWTQSRGAIIEHMTADEWNIETINLDWCELYEHKQ